LRVAWRSCVYFLNANFADPHNTWSRSANLIPDSTYSVNSVDQRKIIHYPQAMRSWTILGLCLTFSCVAVAQRSGSAVCSSGRIRCFLPDREALPPSSAPAMVSKPQRGMMSVRALHGGILAHQWVELETSSGKVTIGYGPASLPFLDAGQISIWHEDGRREHSGLRLLPTNFNYAKPPDSGNLVGAPVSITLEQADAILRKQAHRKRIFPYIPIFHDCRTFVCTVKASATGKSSLPCYLLFKGYWEP
jgi:hypothetical protein